MSKKFIGIQQQDTSDCGPACLAAILAYWGLNIAVSKIRVLAGTNAAGTSMYALQQVALKLGFNTLGARCNIEQLENLPVPSIVHININHYQHYWLVYQHAGNKMRYMDPVDGKIHSTTLQDFKKLWTGKLLWFEKPEKEVEHKESAGKRGNNLRRLYQFILPHKSFLVILFLTGALSTVAGLAISVFLQQLLDKVLPAGDKHLLSIACGVLLLIFVLHVLLQAFRTLLAIRMGKLLDKNILQYYYEKVLQLPLPYFNSFQIGELMSRMQDATKIRVFIQEFSLHVIVNVLVLLFSVAVMFAASPQLTIFITATIPVFMLLIYFANRLHQKWNLIMMQQAAQVESTVVEQFQQFFAIKYLALEHRANKAIQGVLLPFLEKAARFGNLQTGLSALNDLVTRLVTILLLWFGAQLVLNKELSTGELVFFFAVSGYFMSAILFFVQLPAGLQDAIVAVDRLFDITDSEAAKEKSIPLALDQATDKTLVLHNISFGYGWGHQVIKNLNLQLALGSFVVIRGKNGSGKSTLLYLIAGLYSPQEGIVLVGGEDVQLVCKRSLRMAIGLVPREITVFRGSILDNIILDDPDPDQTRLELIIRLLQLNEKFAHLEGGLLQSFGGAAHQLSGGQLQLIGIARALYKQPAVLLLDEPTAHTDADTARVVLQALEWYRSLGNTIVVATHDARVLKLADCFYDLQNGNICSSNNSTKLL